MVVLLGSGTASRFRALAEYQHALVWIGYLKLAHTVRFVGERTRDISAARRHLIVQGVDAAAEDAHNGAAERCVDVEVDGGIAEAQTDINRRILPGKRHRETQDIPIISERLRHILHVKDRRHAVDLIAWGLGHVEFPFYCSTVGGDNSINRTARRK